MPAARPPEPSPPRRLKMKDLEEATGVGRETIRFYIRQGLLPEPERPAKNVAWYDASFVERIRLIKELQEKRYLPLHVIRRIVGDDGEPSRAEVEALLELDGRLFRPAGGAAKAAPERLDAVAERVGISVDEIRVAADAGAVRITSHEGAEWVESSSLEILELFAALRREGFDTPAGFPPEQIGLYVDMVEWLAREELRMFSRGVTGKVPRDRAVHMAEVGIDLLNQIIALLRKRTLLERIAEGNVPPPGRRKAPASRRKAAQAGSRKR